MKGQIGTKHYDTDKSKLIETRPDGIQVYRKKGRSTDFYIYNPQGRVVREKFFDLPPEEAIKYVPENTYSKKLAEGKTIKFSQYDLERIRRLALLNNMQIIQFILMLVDEYEQRQRDLSKD